MATETFDLKARALEFMDLMSNKRDFDTAAQYIHPDVVQKNALKELRGKEALLTNFKTMTTVRAPDFHVDFIDSVREGNKVWAFVRVSGLPGGIVKDSIDITEWSDDGRLLYATHVQRNLEKDEIPQALGSS
ncbi:hypothetical protein UA08_00469 [Talaromyces atroroseus]|uniref:SnoaL-like domain-containing protein n=1 Tax=Talaromyces atroroseus TaxID=1441469 RepID=A0A225ASE4_TALAT|nr:hypothetical protein UA08_00469 [Talaromyces atroroseus]OKL64502.1 hypothetical protein UA08_00469 [Talaromyces atroroseus]